MLVLGARVLQDACMSNNQTQMTQDQINRVRSAINFAPTNTNDIKARSENQNRFDAIVESVSRKTGLTSNGIKSLFIEFEMSKSPASIHFLTPMVNEICESLDALHAEIKN